MNDVPGTMGRAAGGDRDISQVDGVSGAVFTDNDFKDAVSDALILISI